MTASDSTDVIMERLSLVLCRGRRCACVFLQGRLRLGEEHAKTEALHAQVPDLVDHQHRERERLPFVANIPSAADSFAKATLQIAAGVLSRWMLGRCRNVVDRHSELGEGRLLTGG
jgi:hypothetical protein